MTTTLKAIVRKLRTDGLYAVYTRIVHNRKPGYIKTNKIVDANYISKENEPTDPVVNEYCSMLVRQIYRPTEQKPTLPIAQNVRTLLNV